MDLGPLRTLVTDISFATFAVDATVTRPDPDSDPIETRAIWMRPITEQAPSDGEVSRSEPVLHMALPRAVVATVPKGTIVAAPKRSGSDVLSWTVDSTVQVDDPDFTHVLVLPTPEPN